MRKSGLEDKALLAQLEELAESLSLKVRYEKIKKEASFYHGKELKQAILHFKKNFLLQTLRSVQGNRTKAAKILKIQRTYLSRLISELKIQDI